MSDETLRKFIKQYIEAQESPEIPFVWQGWRIDVNGSRFLQKSD